MSDRTYLNLEFLKKEAKALLRHCRSGEVKAIDRVRAQIPTLREQIQLADVQHAIAREAGYLNWTELKRKLTPSADFNQPGSEGQLPDGYKDWQRGVNYTVSPEMLKPLQRGREYYMYAGVWRRVAPGEEFSDYDTLYRKTNTIVARRLDELTCRTRGARLHHWVAAHGWFRKEVPNASLVATFVSVGVLYPHRRQAKPEGVRPPEPDALSRPGGMGPHDMDPNLWKHAIEGYVDFMGEDDRKDPSIAMFSYGEYVPTTVGLDYEPFIRRAEDRTRFSIRLSGKEKRPLQIVRRQWFCATNPDIAVVHIYFQT